MPKTSGDFTLEQARAMAIAAVDGQMTAAEVKAAAKAGELGDLEAFDPSEATVNRCARALRAEREGQAPAERYKSVETEAYDMLDALAREIWAEKKAKGSMNAVKVKAYAGSVRLLGMNLDKPKGKGKPEDDEPEQASEPEPKTPALLQRLATQPTQRATTQRNGTAAEQHNGAAAGHAGRV